MRYSKYPIKVFKCRGLSPVDKHVYMTLAFGARKGVIEISRALLSKEAGLAKNTVSASLNKLRNLNFIEWSSGYRFGENFRVNTYYLLDPCHTKREWSPKQGPDSNQTMASVPIQPKYVDKPSKPMTNDEMTEFLRKGRDKS